MRLLRAIAATVAIASAGAAHAQTSADIVNYRGPDR
jgi:hypothetical protein